jgi:D-3-phosphoglycerate dehydrogenase
MSGWNILLTDGLEVNGQYVLRALAHVHDRQDIPQEELLQVIADYDALIVRSRTRVTAQVIEAGRRLKVIGRAGVGVDNIDLEAARSNQVVIVNAPSSTSIAVAELALGLMLALARSIPQADAGMKRGEWLKKQLQGVELSGKMLGILGVGNIGKALAQRASALGMSVGGYDPLLTDDEIQQRGVSPFKLADLLGRADYLSLHVPLTVQTKGMINQETIEMMKPGMRLICTARGGLIDEDALLEALRAGKVAGAALDVFAQEPPGKNPLVEHPNVIASPHIGAQTAEAQRRAAEDIAHEVLAALRGEQLRWRVA